MIRILIILLLISGAVSAQDFPQYIAGKYRFNDSMQLKRYKNNVGLDSVLSTNTEGKIIMKKFVGGSSPVRDSVSAAAPVTYNSSTGVFGADTTTANTGLATKYQVGLKLNITDTANIRARLYAGSGIGLSGSYPNITISNIRVVSDSAWSLNLNYNTSGKAIGTADANDFILKTNSVEQLRALSSGGIRIPSSTGTSNGVIFKGSDRFIHSFQLSGTDTTLGENLFIGKKSGNFTMTGSSGGFGTRNLAIGDSTLFANTTGYRNVAIGTWAGAANTTGFENTIVGANSHENNTTGRQNTAIGAISLDLNTTGFRNTAVGFSSMQYGTTAERNTAIGGRAMQNVSTGFGNAALGFDALAYNSTADHNVAVGLDALYYSNGSHNTALGDSTLWGLFGLGIPHVGYKNVAVGSRAGYHLGDTYPNFASIYDTACIFLGGNASRDSSISYTTSLQNMTVIGYNARGSASNQVVLGNDAVTTTKLKGAINAKGYGSGTHTGTPTKTLQVDASGNIIEGTVYSGIPTIQQTLTAGSTLTGSNTVTNTSNVLTFSGGLLSQLNNSLGVTPDDTKGIRLINSSISSSGNQQISPAIHWVGNGWQSGANFDHTIDFRSYVLPVESGTPGMGKLITEGGYDGGTYEQVFAINRIGGIEVGKAGTTLGAILTSGNTSGTITIQPQAAAGTYNFNLPTTAGTAGQVLTSQAGGSNAMTWSTAGSGITVGTTTITSGTSGRVAFNNAGVYGESANLFWDNTNSRLGIGNASPTSKLDVNGGIHITGQTYPTTGAGLEINYDAGTNYITGYDRGGSAYLPVSFNASTYTFLNSGNEVARFTGGSVSIGNIAPTARLHIAAGTATASTAPLKLTAGTNLSTTEAGAVEFDGTHLYFTAANAGTRYQLDQQSGLASTNFIYNEEFTGSTSATYTLANSPVVGKLVVFKNGIKLPASEFSLSGAIVTLTSARLSGDLFSNDYIK